MVSKILTDAELCKKLDYDYGYPTGKVTHKTREMLIKMVRGVIGDDGTRATSGRMILRGELNNLEYSTILLFLDLETSGLEIDCDVLQIAVKQNSTAFNRYIKPTKSIDPNASLINKLYERDGELYRNNVKLETETARNVLLELLQFFKNFRKTCTLVAHNAPFDASHLIRLIRKEKLENEFASVVDGFVDTLDMFRARYPEKRGTKGALTLSTLVKESLALSTDGAHDAAYDVFLLEKLALHHFERWEMISNKQTFAEALTEFP